MLLQGRVWSGRDALARGLVDALGGVHCAVQLAREAAGIKPEERVTVIDLATSKPSPLAALRGAFAVYCYITLRLYFINATALTCWGSKVPCQLRVIVSSVV
jgi:ClpP class serine protease